MKTMMARYSMPDNIPDYIKGLPEGAQSIFVEVFNSTLAKTNDEEQARIAGWGAVKNSYEKQGDEWVKKAVDVLSYMSALKAEGVEEGTDESTVQVFRTGKFKHPLYGTFTITDEDLDRMQANFDEHRPKPPTELVVDYEHMSADGRQIAPAAGWVKSLVRKAGELFAKVHWTPKAAGMIRAGEYRYISPEWHMHYKDKESGKDIGPTLLSMALTNRPFIEGMQSVALSETMIMAEWDVNYINNLPDSSFAYVEGGGEKDEQGKTVPRTLRHLPYRNADGSINLAHLRNALARLDQTSLSPEAKAQARSKLETAAKQADVGEANQDSNKAQEVVALEKQIRELLGLDDKADVLAVLKDMKSKMDTMTQAQTASETNAQQLTQRAEKAEKDLAEANGKLLAHDVQVDVDQALKDGHILPKQVEWAKSFRAKDPAGFKTFLASAPKIGPDGTIKGAEVNDGDAIKLTEAEEKTGKLLGVSPEETLAQKKRDAAARKG